MSGLYEIKCQKDGSFDKIPEAIYWIEINELKIILRGGKYNEKI